MQICGQKVSSRKHFKTFQKTNGIDCNLNLSISYFFSLFRNPALKKLAIQTDIDNLILDSLPETMKRCYRYLYNVHIPCKNCRSKKCKHCHAYLLPSETDNFCCSGGQVKLPVSDPPNVLKEKLLNKDNAHHAFKSDIRSYNNSLAMASLGFDEMVRMPGYNPTLKFRGKMYHKIGPLRANDGKNKSFAQMYINDPSMDSEAEADRRIQSVTIQRSDHKIDKKVMLELQAMMHEHNPYVASFKALMDIPDEEVEDVEFVLRKDKVPVNEHKGRYNLPTSCNEIALIALNDVKDNADVRIQRKDGPTTFISDMNQSFDPLHYVLLFPDGSPGWCVNLFLTDPKTGGW